MNDKTDSDSYEDFKKKYFSKKVKELLHKNGYTQRDLAEYLGISEGTVSMWLSEQSFPRYVNINKIARFFNVKYNDLVIKPDIPTVPISSEEIFFRSSKTDSNNIDTRSGNIDIPYFKNMTKNFLNTDLNPLIKLKLAELVSIPTIILPNLNDYNDLYLLQINDNSFNQQIDIDSKVIFKKYSLKEIGDGDIVVCEINGMHTIRFIYKKSDTYILRPNSTDVNIFEKHFIKEDESVKIIGKVITMIKST